MNQLVNRNIASMKPLPTFRNLAEQVPLSLTALETVREAQRVIPDIIRGVDNRFLIIVGPCSIHNLASAREYARRLSGLRQELSDKLYLVMRVCGDKPRTGKDWEGFFNDPHMDGSCDIAYGMQAMRTLMRDINALGVPVGAEILDADNTHCVSDLLGYAWVGARTVQSQDHRKLASGLTPPVGFKNPTHGPIDAAVSAIQFARHACFFSGPDDDGVLSRIETRGNPLAHLILRGADSGPNYQKEFTGHAAERLVSAGVSTRMVVDCSHKNALGDYRKQVGVLFDVMRQRKEASVPIAGVMIESHVQEGRQSLVVSKDAIRLDPFVSVTDACLGWEDTERILREAHRLL